MEIEVFEGKIFTVTVENIGGATYERIYQRHGVTVFPLTDEGKIRFVQKTAQTGLGPIQISPMCGYLEGAEDPLTAAKRELQEELGLDALEWKSLATIPSCGGINKLQHFFVARGLRATKKAVHIDAEENILGSIDLTTDEVKERLLSGEFDKMGGENCFCLLKLILLTESQP